MIPIDQRIIAREKGVRGDCFSACVASILHLTLDDVPIFWNDPGSDNIESFWTRKFQRWLFARGYQAIDVLHFKDSIFPQMLESVAPVYGIVSGKSPRGDWFHAVVWEFDIEGARLIHDPHPSREGTKTIDRVTFLIKL